jgi:hypothetical protein
MAAKAKAKGKKPPISKQEKAAATAAADVGGDDLNDQPQYSTKWLEGMPKMKFVIPEDVKPGLAIMNKITAMISSGQPIDADTHTQIVGFLTDLQAKADLVQVAQIPLALGRLSRLTTLAGKAEQKLEQILDADIPMEPKEIASILKALYTERSAIQEQLLLASTKPTISSPDAIGRTMSAPVPQTSTDAALPNPESRRRVTSLFEQVRAKALASAKLAQAKQGAIEVESEEMP